MAFYAPGRAQIRLGAQIGLRLPQRRRIQHFGRHSAAFQMRDLCGPFLPVIFSADEHDVAQAAPLELEIELFLQLLQPGQAEQDEIEVQARVPFRHLGAAAAGAR